MACTRPVIAPVQRQRFLDAAPFAEKIRERIRQAEVRGELRAVVRAAENPDLGARRTGRMRLDRRERMAVVERLAGYPRAKLVHLARETRRRRSRAD